MRVDSPGWERSQVSSYVYKESAAILTEGALKAVTAERFSLQEPFRVEHKQNSDL